jgi:tetratricopeptide (TPR) repeat protein
MLSTLASPLQAKEQSWIEIRTTHFTVVTDAGTSDGVAVAQRFEQFRAVLKQVLPRARVDPGRPVVIVAARNKASLKELLPGWEARGQDPIGVFIAGPEKHYVVLRVDLPEAGAQHLVLHEYTHVLTQLNFVRVPLWLGEGLAEFYAGLDIEGGEAVVGRPDLWHIGLLRKSQLLPIETLLAVDHSSPHYGERDKSSLFYAQSWALVHYLLMGDGQANVRRFRDYVGLITAGVDPMEAARRALGDLKQLGRTLEAYVHNVDFYMARVDTSTSAPQPEPVARTLTRAESLAVRGDLHRRLRQMAQSRALLEEAARLDPQLAAARESLALLCLDEQKPDEALRWAGEAVVAGPARHLAHYTHGLALMAQGGDPKRIEASLTRAIELDGTFAEGHTTLADFYVWQRRDLQRALALARKAVELEPGELRDQLVVGRVLLAMNSLEAARHSGEQALRMADSDRDRDRVHSFLQQVREAVVWQAGRGLSDRLKSGQDR